MSVEDLPEVDVGEALELTSHEAERVGWFEGLGFDLLQAVVLATARDSSGQLVTVHDVRKAIAAGCDADTAFRIFA